MTLNPSKGLLTLSTSSDFREKAIKTLQYLAKLLYACGFGGARTKDIAKFLSSSRDVMTFMRWVKYGGDFDEARSTHEEPLRSLMLTEATLNVTVDCMNDVIVLNKLGLVGRLPALTPSWSFGRLTNLLDSILAAVGVAVAVFKIRAAASESALAKQRVALISYIGSLLKNTNATQLQLAPFHGDRLAALGGLLSAAISTNKLITKHLPPTPPSERLAGYRPIDGNVPLKPLKSR